MKRTIILLTAAALAASPAAAQAAKPAKKKPVPTTRTVVWDYQGVFGAYSSTVGGGGVCGANPKACFELPTQKHERMVKFSATDGTGQKIAVQYSLDGDYDNTVVNCSAGDIAVKKGTTVNFYMIASPDCPGVATQGKVTIQVTGLK